MRGYWAHCKECKDHFVTKSGTCVSCQIDNTMSCDTGAEEGCPDCTDIERIEGDLAKARRTIAAKKSEDR